jgi:hypothetical protein
MIAASTRVAAPTPTIVERQPRTTPTASTIVSASTASTALARKVARKRKTLCAMAGSSAVQAEGVGRLRLQTRV